MNKEDNLSDQWENQGSSRKDNFPDFGGSSFSNNDNKKTDVPTSKYFGIDNVTSYLVSLKLNLKSGQCLSVPYGLQPFISFFPEEKEGRILIETMKYDVEIKGRNLIRLYEWIDVHKVKWVKESATGVDDNAENLFVREITISKNEP